MTAADDPAIPVVSLAALHKDPSSVTSELVAAYSSLGFAYLVDHGVNSELTAQVFAMSRAVHRLPEADKRVIEVNAHHRGYLPLATSTDRTSTLGGARRPNVSESFMMLRELPEGHADLVDGCYLAGPNQWPPDIPGFRETLLAYHDAMARLAHRIIAAIDGQLGMSGSMLRWFDEPTTWLRLLHYPPQSPQAPADEFGSAPHTDFGAITLLAQDDVGGLAVQDPSGIWHDVPPRRGALVMNVGDLLHRWSGGRLISTPHRVTNRSGRERFSVPFFYDPTVRAPMSLDGQGETFGDYVRHHLEGSYEHHASSRRAAEASPVP